MTDTALTPTNQDGATDAEKTAARKTEAIDRIQQLFNQLKERGHESMEPQRVTIVSHPEDFQLKPLGHTGVHHRQVHAVTGRERGQRQLPLPRLPHPLGGAVARRRR